MMFFFKGKRNARQLHVSKHSCPTRRVSELEKNEISTARAALEELASQSGVVAFTPGGGGQALLRLRARSENRYSNLMALRLDGAVACATGLEQPSTFANSDWFIRTLANDDFTVTGKVELPGVDQQRLLASRSEESRVGKEGGRTGRERWTPRYIKKNKTQ